MSTQFRDHPPYKEMIEEFFEMNGNTLSSKKEIFNFLSEKYDLSDLHLRYALNRLFLSGELEKIGRKYKLIFKK